jgi:creatinine amidohydrolase
MPPWQHFKNICYHIRQADTLGFHAAILITGHYGPNWQDLKTLIDLIQPHVGTRLYGLPDFEANQPGFDEDGKSGGDHAGKVETSLLWATHPECVDITRLPDPEDEGPHFAMGKTAFKSNRKVGERMVDDEVAWLGTKSKELLDAYDTERPDARMRTFEEVERFWDDVIRPRFKDFKTMQQNWRDDAEIPESSVWHANWRVPDRG